RVGLAWLDFFAVRAKTLGQLGHQTTPSTSRPAERALPAMVRTAASMSAAVRSGHFMLATSSSWARVTLPTLWVFGVAEPLSILAVMRSGTAAGGVFLIKVKERSA